MRVDRVVLALAILWPGAALAGPVVGFLGSLVGGGGFAAFATSFVGRLVIGIGLSLLQARLAKRKAQRRPNERMANYAQPVSFMERVYGRVRKGGPMGFTAFANNQRHYTVLIAAHRTKGPVQHYLDKRPVSIGGTGAVTTAPIAGYGSIRAYRGLPGQTVDAALDAAFPEVTAAHDYAGLSYSAITASRAEEEKFSEVYPGGQEWTYAPIWDGNDTIIDPRLVATNAILWSEQMQNAVWDVTQLAGTISADAAVAPDGAQTADRWVESSANAVRRLSQAVPIGFGEHTFSAHVKRATGTRNLALEMDPLWFGPGVRAVFDLVTGTVTLGPAAGLAAEAVPAAHGYWRVALTAPTLGDLWTPGASQDLLGWWDLADAGTLTINASQRVLAVADKSGRGVPLTASAAEAPTFGATTINGKPAATFGGTQVLWAGNSTSFLPALDGQQVFVALVVVASEGIIYGDRAGSGVAFQLSFFSGNLYAAAYDDSLAFSSTPWAGAGAGPAIIVQKFDLGAPAAGRQFIQINGGPDVGANTASGAFTGPPAEHQLVTVGNWSGTFTNEGLRGSIAEYVIGRSWDDVVRAVGYLAHKWWGAGAANPLPASHPYKESPPTITAARVGRMDLLMTASGTATGAYTGGGTAGLDLWGVQFERNDQVGAYLRSEGTAAQGEIGADGTRGWTDNAALVIAEEIRFHGKELDWDEVAEEADICDQLVTNRTGGVQRRWTINGTLDDEMEWEQVRADLAEACDAFFYERPDGRVGFKVGRWIEPTVTLTARDFLSLRVAENDWGPDTSGEFVMRYVEPSRDYQETPSGVYVVDPGGVRTVAESFLVHSHNQAARLLKRLAAVSRPQYSISGTIKMIGYDCIGQRFLRIDHEDLGLMITVEVAKLVREADGISFTLDAISVEPTDFGFDAAVEEPLPQSFYAVEQTAEVAPPAALAGLAVEGGGGVAQIEYSWGPQHVSLRQELRYRPVGQGEEAWQYETMGRGQISRVITGLVDGTTYEAQLRNVTAAGRTSPWTVLIEVLAVANSTAPAGLSGVSVAKAGSVVNLSWTNPNDGNFQAVRIYRAAGATPFSGAALVRTEFGAPGAADSWQDTTPGTGSVSYWLEPINGSGVAGPRVGPQSVTI